MRRAGPQFENFNALMDRQEILHYLNRIREVWQMLFQGDEEAMGRLDRVTVKAVELTAPRASTQDAEALRRQLLSGEIFSAFSLQEREGIYPRLQAIDGLVPSFFSLFRDYHCLAAYANCVKWLTSPSSRNTVSQALESRFTAANLPADQAFVQEAELTFTSRPARWADQLDLGRRQLYAFSMRHYRAISSESDRTDVLARPTVGTDKTVLRALADLAERIGFESPPISTLKQYPNWVESVVRLERKPPLGTDGPGATKNRRCGLPTLQAYEDDRQFLFLSHLHDDWASPAKGVTSYFVQKSIYLSFFGEPRLIDAAGAVGNAIPPQRLVCDGRPSPPLGLNQPVPPQRSPESREIATDAGDIASQIRDHTERESGGQAEREQERLIQNHIRQEMERCGQRENKRREEGGSISDFKLLLCWV